MTTFKESLQGWTDIDGACFCLAVSLGLMPNDNTLFRTKAKHVFWSNNDIGNKLYDLIFGLIDLGILLRNETEDRVKWNPDFKGSWE